MRFVKPKHPTPTQILEIADRRGEFAVSWRYRDEPLYKKCKRLVKEGKLRRLRCAHGMSLFVPVIRHYVKDLV